MRLNLRLPRTFSLALLATRLSTQGAQIELAAKFVPVQPCPALANAARTNQIPLDQVESPTGGDAINPGDSLTALVTFCEKNDRRTQWLLHLEAVAPKAK